MITLFTGGTDSNRSIEAENFLQSLNGRKYYLATMKTDGDSRKKKVERLRKRREDKGFVTIEQETAIVKAIDKIKWMDMLLGGSDEDRILLIENIPYLAANELFIDKNDNDGSDVVSVKEAESTILCGLALLQEFFKDIIVVTDPEPNLSYYGDGVTYTEEEIRMYSELMKELNTAFSSYAGEIIRLT